MRVGDEGPVTGSEYAVSFTGSTETRPALAAGALENYLVAWEDGRSQIPSGGLDVYVARVRNLLLSGRVYEGEVGNRSKPLANARVRLFCSSSPATP